MLRKVYVRKKKQCLPLIEDFTCEMTLDIEVESGGGFKKTLQLTIVPADELM